MVGGIYHSPSANLSTGLSILALSSSCKGNIVLLFPISISFPQLVMKLGLFSYLLQKEPVFIQLPARKSELPFLKHSLLL